MNLPPGDVGLYARNHPTDLLARFRLVALPSTRADTPSQASALRSSGVKVWIYSAIESWRPENWRASLARDVALAKRTGAEGIIADPENGWADTSDRRSKLRELGAALAEASNEVRVGVTSFPLFPDRGTLAQACRRRVWGSPQIYINRPAATYEAWFRDWESHFGRGLVIPSVAAWRGNQSETFGDRYETEEEYQDYLSRIPRAAGALGWTLAGGSGPASLPPFIERSLLAWNPARSAPGRVAVRAAGILSSAEGRIALAVTIGVVALLAVALFLARR